MGTSTAAGSLYTGARLPKRRWQSRCASCSCAAQEPRLSLVDVEVTRLLLAHTASTIASDVNMITLQLIFETSTQAGDHFIKGEN